MINEIDFFNESYYDAIGGYHSEGIGYSPLGEWCGECCWESCEQCPRAKEIKDISDQVILARK